MASSRSQPGPEAAREAASEATPEASPGAAPEIAIVSLGHFTEAYPNTYFKLKLLSDRFGLKALPIIFRLDKSMSTSGLRNLKISIMLTFIFNNLRAWCLLLRKRPRKAYLCYPGVVLAYLCKLIPAQRRPQIFLDAFISIYDTVVMDRKILAAGSILARVLFKLEQSAYRNCTAVLVDTHENCAYMANLFDIPEQHFRAINLTVPGIVTSADRKQATRYTCVFIGTFVPLQGVGTIAQAANLLQQRRDIEFRIIGNGQDAPLLRAAMDQNSAGNITWIDAWQSTAQLAKEIDGADICLGIFGTTNKTERVWPFKNYLYMAAGKALITGDSACARRLAQLTDRDDFLTCELGSPAALAESITTLLDSAQLRKRLGVNARAFYDAHLGHDVALRSLIALLDDTPAPKTSR